MFHNSRIDQLLALRDGGIDERFCKYTSDVDVGPAEFTAFFECPLCGQIEFRILRRSINCRRFTTPCCNHSIALHIRECPCEDSGGLDCLEHPIISTFYIFKGDL